jgi:mono/diheme cytochrome c family protein
MMIIDPVAYMAAGFVLKHEVRMRRAAIIIGALAILAALGFFVLTDPRVVSPMPRIGEVKAADLTNGERLFHAGGCASCHAADGGDKTRLSGGHRLGSPFGTFVAPNISPHPQDGIGAWSVTDFVRAMSSGVAPDGSHYFPAFPYTSYWQMPVQDIVDVFGYIMTLPPVAGRAPAHDVGFPFNIRRLLGGWKLLFFAGSPLQTQTPLQPDPTRSETWNRGRYLVEGPSHCAECHSPRHFLGGIIADKRMSGGPDPSGKGHVPNITPHATGIGRWTKSDLVELLTTGFTPEFDSVGASMKAVVDNTAKLPASDREAIAEYLLTLKPVEGRKKGSK